MKKNKKDEDFSLIPREKLLALYAGLLRCGMVEEFVAKNLPVRRSATRTSTAAAVAICIDHEPGDSIAANSRDFLPHFVAGRSLALIFSAMQLPTVQQRSRFAAQLRAALKNASKNHRCGNRRVVFVFGRPAAGRQWQSLLRIATSERLPIIFLCKGQSRRRSLRPARYLPAIAVDKDDVVALYRVASEGITHARRGNGPTLIECIPWSSPSGKKPLSAIAKMEAYLEQKGISPSRRKTTVTAEFASELGKRKRTVSK